MTTSFTPNPGRLARLSAITEICACGHAGWIHTPEGCVGQNATSRSQMQFTPCECKLTAEQHIDARMAAS